MKITILCVGKPHEPHVKPAIELFESRLKRFAVCEWIFLPHVSTGDAQRVKTAETGALLAKIKPDDTVILLDERGQQWSSPDFSLYLDQWQAAARGRIVFVIGGAYGVGSPLLERANATWSLSRLVFPHQLVRVLLVEQLYRAFSIKHNLPYHHQ